LGYVPAMHGLGVSYCNGNFKNDKEKGIHLIKLAGLYNYGPSLNQIRHWCLNGIFNYNEEAAKNLLINSSIAQQICCCSPKSSLPTISIVEISIRRKNPKICIWNHPLCF